MKFGQLVDMIKEYERLQEQTSGHVSRYGIWKDGRVVLIDVPQISAERYDGWMKRIETLRNTEIADNNNA